MPRHLTKHPNLEYRHPYPILGLCAFNGVYNGIMMFEWLNKTLTPKLLPFTQKFGRDKVGADILRGGIGFIHKQRGLYILHLAYTSNHLPIL
jgi:hypothetical protein